MILTVQYSTYTLWHNIANYDVDIVAFHGTCITWCLCSLHSHNYIPYRLDHMTVWKLHTQKKTGKILLQFIVTNWTRSILKLWVLSPPFAPHPTGSSRRPRGEPVCKIRNIWGRWMQWSIFPLARLHVGDYIAYYSFFMIYVYCSCCSCSSSGLRDWTSKGDPPGGWACPSIKALISWPWLIKHWYQHM